ncbi:PolC-type DNA polymerase III [Intestinimonas butyriciproducens]|uniref:PolC-type DNA polymerase III n=1 Tax=Intestinimonas butyriciproducens TaxID=1297617 RepID=UPI001C117118|nr:PolC-type DNA polymerase III [Intestinimonas butyriciproducens]MBU5229188.1 PolC-type DNA polymerase III [Intestinimonas butyriciproducens]
MPEQEKIPLLSLFSAWVPPADLRPMLVEMLVTGAVIDKRVRSIQADLQCPVCPSDALRTRMEQELASAYGVRSVAFRFFTPAPAQAAAEVEEAPPMPTEADMPPEPEETCPQHLDMAPEDPMEIFRRTERIRQEALRNIKPAVPSEKREKASGNKLLFGKIIKRFPCIEMKDIALDSEMVTIEGDVFATDHVEMKKRGAWIVRFDITDRTNSIRVAKFLVGDEGKALAGALKEGQHLIVQGRVSPYQGELQIEPTGIAEGQRPPARQDMAEEGKRVELHLHTRMSSMDATTDIKEVIKRAAAWGHPAIAITDHGVCHDFPTAYSTAQKAGIKMLFGVEAYFINDVDDMPTVRGTMDASFCEEYVCFDLEATGLDSRKDRITEIGAVVLKNGVVTDEVFSTFVDPERPIPYEVSQLTGITDDMVRGAPSQSEAVRQFLKFVNGRPLAAHNAGFDVGFIAEACRRMGVSLDVTAVDTLPLAQALLPQLSKHKLDVVADHLGLPSFNHHRATDDASTVAYMLVPFFKRLEEEHGIHSLDPINRWAAERNQKRKGKRRARHLIVLARNQTGLRNLYKLVSKAHLEHFQRKQYPVMPKSLIDENREGLLMGSACEAGELFQAVARRSSWAELKRIASWYDYLEIQPISNNAFMLRPDKNGRTMARDEEELRDFNRTIVELAHEMGKPVVATGDVHFLDPEDEIYRHILLNTKGFEDADAPNPLYFRTTDEMLREFSYLGEETAREVVIDNTHLIAAWCGDLNPLPNGLFAPKLEDSEGELKRLVWGKAKRLYGESPPQIVVDRIETELHDILMRHYDVIYMSAQKLVQDSLDHGYLVGSRGSVGSSIVAFMSGITEVNALPPHYRCPNCKHADFEAAKEGGWGCGADMPDAVCPVCGAKYEKDGFNIPFETFLGFGGDKVPDIDLNFSGEYQSSAHRHTFELFGESHVFRAGTIGTVAEKTAFGYVKKYMEERGKTATKAEMLRLAKGCTGVKRTTGQHPGGMVVIPQDKEIYDFCPVQHPADDTDTDIITTHFEYHSMESNLLKLDMLGHDDPSMIRMMEDLTGVDAKTIPLDDPGTRSIFITSEVLGYQDDPVLGPTGATAIPEFGTSFVRGMLEETKPEEFDILVRLSGFSHGTDVWLGNARDLILSGTATVGQAIGCRDDIMIYLISCGMPEKRAFKIMEAVRKGRGLPEGAEEEMKAAGVPDWYIGSCKKIAYLFPKAHAVAYVMMAFRIAWFKVHEPLAFYAAYFSIRAKAFDATVMCMGLDRAKAKMAEIRAKDKEATAVEQDMLTTLEVVYEFYIRGFTFDQMDLYRSDAVRFGVDKEHGALIPPFMAIPGLGETAALSIVEQRKGKQYLSIEEFSADCPKVTKSHIELLKNCGALAGMPDTSQMTLF